MKSEPSSESAAVDPQSLIDELAGSLRRTAEDVVPWFLENMPPVYFQDTSHDEQLAQLRSILAAKASGRPLEMVLKSENDAQWTMMAPVNRPGILASMAAQLPEDFNLWSAKIHSAKNGQLLLVIFESGDPPRFDPSDPEQAAKLEETIAFAAENFPSWTREQIEDHFSRCTGVSIRTLTPLRICRQRVHFLEVSKTENTTATLEEENDPDVSRIVVTVANSRTRGMLERVATRLARADVNIFRAYLDRIEDDDNGFVNMLGFVVRGPDGKALDPASQLWQSIRKDLLRLKWIDRTTLDLAYSHENLSLTRAEIIMSLCHLVNHILVKRNPYAFDRDRILRHAKKNFDLTTEVVDLFLLRFNPERPLPDEDFESHSAKLHERIDASVDLEAGRTVMHALVDAVAGVMRTNVFLRTRYALSMRIRPELLQTEERPELPYGVFFVHGRSFNGFHVRFRDIARGGIRAVRTIGSDQHTRECERLYDEVYGLAYAQQLKNKDIPEGGSKAVILIEPGTPLRRSVQAFVDSLLDLITPEPSTRARIVDRFGQPEFLYFGPDENISPDMIEWVVERAKQRGYPMPTALMSSKPGAGINHKTYGVTSEGVNVFLRAALESIGIKPTEQPFRVSITGGPDGDVAGNMIRILDRDYSGNARIVGIADGSGVGGYAFAYATGVTDHTIDCINLFYADDDGFNTDTRVYLAGFYVTGLPGGDPNVPPPSYRGWIVTVDLDAAGYAFPITGNDLDGDGLTDFSYTYWFPNCINTVTGPFIAGDPNVPGQGAGMVDAFDAFEQVTPGDPNTDFTYVGSYYFGGVPFAQFYMELFGEANGGTGCPNPGASGNFCTADIDGSSDCIVDLADLAVLLSNYGTTSGATHNQGDLEGNDGDVDLADLAAMLSQYGDDCN